MGGGALKYVREKFESLKVTNLTIVARRHPLMSPTWYCLLFYKIFLLEAACNAMLRCGKERVKASQFVVVHG